MGQKVLKLFINAATFHNGVINGAEINSAMKNTKKLLEASCGLEEQIQTETNELDSRYDFGFCGRRINTNALMPERFDVDVEDVQYDRFGPSFGKQFNLDTHVLSRPAIFSTKFFVVRSRTSSPAMVATESITIAILNVMSATKTASPQQSTYRELKNFAVTTNTFSGPWQKLRHASRLTL